MAIAIISPKFSFVQFGPSGLTSALPVQDADDVFFQLLLETSTADEADELMAANIRCNVYDFVTVIASLDDFDNRRILLYAEDAFPITIHRVGLTKVLLYWNHGLPGIESISAEKCVKFCIAVPVGDDYLFSSSNSFYKSENEFTTRIQYKCNDNSFDFLYCPEDIENRIRVKMQVRRPQMPEERGIYRESGGNIRITKMVITKEYEVVTDLLEIELHEKLNIALSHDAVYIINDRFQFGVTKSSAYEIDWPELNDFDFASAKFKLTEGEFYWRNTNCEMCDTCIPIGITITIDFPDAEVGVAYNYSIPLQGDAPYVIVVDDEPSWMEAEIVDGNLVFSGTPTEVATNQRIKVRVKNCFNTSYVDIEKLINVTTEVEPPECISLAFVLEPNFPNAYEDRAYEYSIYVTGTLPIAISDIVKPAWMTIEVDGNEVIHHGTPPSLSTGVAVSYVISNCDEAHDLTVDDSFNVVEYPFTSMFKVNNALVAGNITEILNIAITPSFPASLAPGSTYDGSHGFFDGLIGFTASGSGISGWASLYVDSTRIEAFEFSGVGNYYFSSREFPADSYIYIRFSTTEPPTIIE